jgi:hypothetical protein
MGVAPLKTNNITAVSAEDKAKVLNDTFSSIFTQEDTSNMPVMNGTPAPPMADLQITRNGVLKLLQNLKPHKAGGPDKIAARVLKESATSISTVVTFIYQQSLDTSCTPNDWKQAFVTPIYKKGKRSIATNYRPVSLTCILCKTFEHIMVSNIMKHLDTNSILVDYQHGFRHHRSCESQLLITSSDIARALNNRKQVDMAVLDFEKAFDKVPHDRLLLKLDHYGIRGKSLDWIRAFLTGRTQAVVVDGARSNFSPVTSGVPQGSVLGPVLFLLYINDIGHNTTSIVRLFADDCLIYRVIENDNDIGEVQQDLNRLTIWADTWQMSFNVKKCVTIRITNARKHVFLGDYYMAGEKLQWAESVHILESHSQQTSHGLSTSPAPRLKHARS